MLKYFILFQLISIQVIQTEDFMFVSNSAIRPDLVNSTNLISSLKQTSKYFCLSACNLNPLCLTLTYMGNDNCFLYNRYYNSTELMATTEDFYYAQKSKNKHLN